MRAQVFLGIAVLVLSAGCGAPAARPNVVRLPAPTPAPPPPPPPPPAVPHLEVTRILTFGDSLTEGEATPIDPPVPLAPVDPATTGSTRSYPYKLQSLLHTRYPTQVISIYNGGKGGEAAGAARARLAELLDRFHPGAVILMDGVNDLNGGVTPEAAAQAVGALVTEIRAHNAVVFLCTIPRQRRGSQRAYSVDQVEPFNQALTQTAADAGVQLIDIYPEITLDLLAPDGLHLTQTGNQLLAEMLLDALRSRFELPSTTTRHD
jgi:lysophospholipase L1-like esterase